VQENTFHTDLGDAAKQTGDEDEHKAAEGHGDVGLVVQFVAAVEQILIFNAQGFQLLAGTVVPVVRVGGIISME